MKTVEEYNKEATKAINDLVEQQRNDETLRQRVKFEDALDGATAGIERALFLAYQAMEGHGYTFNQEAKHWFDAVIDTLEQTKLDIKRSLK